ncbi:MAG: hypothetical protein P1V81_05855 [Planctomycetota bacterium]|nr:hypothetical protein [Planctomycetota bacterium]
MTITPTSRLRDVSRVSAPQALAIQNFLQGAVYCWCKNRPDEWFSLRDLMGGTNFYWEDTPLIALYEKHKGTSADPVKAAGQDAGWILKSVVSRDTRTFETREANMIREYRWRRDDA